MSVSPTSVPFLESDLNRILSLLTPAVFGCRSAHCKLKRPPNEINLAEIIRLIEGPLAPVGCVSEKFYERCSCPSEEKCGIRSIMKEVRAAVVKILETVTLAHLCERYRKLQGEPAHPLDFMI